MIIGLALAWLGILAGGWLGWQLLRQNGRILLRLDELEKRLNEFEFGESQAPEGLPVGVEAPAFELPDRAGDGRSLAHYRGQSVLLIFLNPACGFCRELAPKLAALSGVRRQAQRDAGLPVTAASGSSQSAGVAGALQNGSESPPQVLLVTTGDAEANRRFFAEHPVTCPVLLQKQSEVASAYRANGTPSGYLISPEGRIASELAVGVGALLALASGETSQASTVNAQPAANDHADRFRNRSLARSKIQRDGLPSGTPAPDFRLPRLDGQGELALSELRGKRVLLVFSSPGCGPCNALAPELEKFHREHPQVEMVMVSKGEPKENRAKVKEHGLTFPIVLQQQWEISRRYAMFATPVAYMLDEAGIILKAAAVGTDGVLALLAETGRKPQANALSDS